MSRPAIQSDKLNEHLTLYECHPDSECRTNNWWLYDTRAGMNLGMREKTREDALVAALEHWAKRALVAELSHAQLKAKVDAFVEQFVEPEDGDDYYR